MLSRLQPTLQELLDQAVGTFGVDIYHFESGERFTSLAEETFYAASVIKVPIMAAVFDLAAKGQLTLSEKIVVRYEDMVTGSGILQSLTPGIEMSIYDLVTLMIIDSDNTATNILIDRVGTATIQQLMREWGMQDSLFYNKLQIVPVHLEGSNTISPRDMTQFLIQIAKGQVVSWKACCEMVKVLKQQRYMEGLPSLLPEEDGLVGALPSWECAHKTGNVTGREHDVGLLYFPGHTFAVSVLSKDIVRRADAHQVMGRIGRLLYENALQSPPDGSNQNERT